MNTNEDEKTKTPNAFRRWYIPGAYLLVMFYIWVGLVMSTLSAHQLRHKVLQANTLENALTMSTVRQLYKENIDKQKEAQLKYDTQVKPLSIRRDNVDQTIERLTTENQAAEIKLLTAESALFSTLGKIDYVTRYLNVISQEKKEQGDDYKIKPSFLENSPSFTIEQLISWKVLTEVTSESDFKSILAKLRAQLEQDKVLSETLGAEVRLLDEKIKTLENKYKELNVDIKAKTPSTEKNIKLDNSKLNELLDDYAFWGKHDESKFKYFFPMIAFNFTHLPAELLTILVVSMMGILGSLISLTKEYMGNGENEGSSKELRVSDYVFRPILAAVTAFTVFVFAKAGFLIISTPTTSGEGASMSPFFISFLGLMSGMLAEDALRRIITISRGFFGEGDVGRHRWAINLKTVMEKKKKDAPSLAARLRIPLPTVEEWIREDRIVPYEAQIGIATFLDVAEREIFTDISPADDEK